MQIVIDYEDPCPPSTQLIDQIRRAISNGDLKPGDPLPSIRQLARDLELNNKTVAKAYRLLERDSLLESRGYRGTFVHPDGARMSAVDSKAWVLETLRESVVACRKAGITDPEINNAFRSLMREQTTDEEK